MPITIRQATPADAASASQICFDAFNTISRAHNFPPDIPAVEHAVHLMTMFFSAPGLYCVVAEENGRILGSNCLDERALIHGIGPITVDPTTQNRGLGRLLMQAVLDRSALTARRRRPPRAGRLPQPLPLALHHPRLRRPRASRLHAGPRLHALHPRLHSPPRHSGRPRRLQRALHHRPWLRLAPPTSRNPSTQGSALVTERDGRITAYATIVGFFGHATAETTPDLCALIASADTLAGPGILVPTRNSALFRWCLANGLRVTQPMNLMSLGLYNAPAGAFLPSILF